MKRLLATAAALAALTTASSGAETLRVVEVLTTPARTELMQQIAADFEAAHAGVEVELISIPWDTAFERMLAMTMSGEKIDVLELPERWISTLAANDSIHDLGPWIEAWEGKANVTEATLNYTRLFDDTAYFMPYGYFVRAMFYNPGLLAQAGHDHPPATMDEFLTMVRDVSKLDGKYGYCLRGARGGFVGWWLMITAQTGAPSWFNEDGTSVFDSPEVIKGIQDMIDLYRDGAAPPDSVNWGFNETVAGFYSGTCAFLDQDPDALIQIQERMGPDEFANIPVPLGPKGRMSPPVGIIGWSIPTSSENPDLAWDFIARMTTPEVNLEWAKFIGVVPAVAIPAEDTFYNAPQFEGFFTELNDPRWDLRPWPAHLPELGEFFDVLALQTAQSGLLGQMTAQELGTTWAAFLTEAQQRWMAEQ